MDAPFSWQLQYPWPRTPLLALSGYGQDKDRQRSRDSGFREHLVKPVKVDQLARLLETLGQAVN